MKLCALTQSYAPTGGGVRTMLHAQQAWCAAHGDLQHVLIVPGAEDSVTRDGRLATYTIASPLVPGSSSYRLLLRSDKVLRILRDEMPDVIEVHCAYNLPWTALLHRRRHGGIVSGMYMTDLPVAYVETPIARRGLRRVARAARAAAERYIAALYRRCDAAIAISPTMLSRLRAMGVGHARCVPLGVDLDLFHPSRRDDTLRAELVGSGATDGLVMIYAGRLDGEKQPDVVLEAFAEVRREMAATLVLAGDGPMRTALEERGRAIGGVHVLPFVHDRARLARLLASADIYVSAMAHETFGLSVVEAQACGLPVVGVRAGAMTDRVRDGIDGKLAAPDSPRELAAHILHTPRHEWRCMGQRARARVESEFSWNRTFETLFGMYRDLLATSRAGTTTAHR